jgi:hypothetical protein
MTKVRGLEEVWTTLEKADILTMGNGLFISETQGKAGREKGPLASDAEGHSYRQSILVKRSSFFKTSRVAEDREHSQPMSLSGSKVQWNGLSCMLMVMKPREAIIRKMSSAV